MKIVLQFLFDHSHFYLNSKIKVKTYKVLLSLTNFFLRLLQPDFVRIYI